MEPDHENSYRWNSIEPVSTKDRILRKFSNFNINKEYTYDELLFIFDEKSRSGNCDRDVAR